MTLSFENKTVLITGGAAGIGREAALAFTNAGAVVTLVDIDEAGLAETAKMVESAGGTAYTVKTDLTDPEAVKDMTEFAHKKMGSIDIAFNNAGIEGSLCKTHQYDIDMFKKVMDINVNAVFYCMKYQLPIMVDQGAGVIINTASVAGLNAFPTHSAYAASKHAVMGLTKSTAIEYARKGIRVNAICPGFTDTNMVSREIGEDAERAAKLIGSNPIQRLGKPEEVASAVLWMASEYAGFVTGERIVLDGGLTAL